MKTLKAIQFIFCFILVISLTGTVPAKSPDQPTIQSVYQWVKDKLQVTGDISYPDIRFLNKQQLQHAFKENNQNSYKRWQKEYGEQKAKEIYDTYLDGLLGLFDPETKIVYIADFIEACDTKAILAHELTHYFQEVGMHSANVDYYSVGNEQYLRELHAYAVEKKYRLDFCANP